MKKTPKILPTFYKSKGTPIFRDTTALPFAQGGIIHFEPSEYGSDAREHYADGGPIYTYSKRPGSYYQRAEDGSWMINNSSTSNQYVPINDPTGKRTELLNKNAVVYNAPAQGAPKPVINQTVWNTAQRQGENDLAKQALINRTREGSQGLYMPDGSLRPQAAQAANWAVAAPMFAPIALEALGTAAAAEIPFTGGVNLGGIANAAGIVHGATEVDDRYKDWQNVASGNMDWKEAALKTGLTGLEFAGAGIPISNANKYIKTINSPTFKTGSQTLVGNNNSKKVLGTIDEFGDLTDEAGGYFPSVSINSSPKNITTVSTDKVHSIGLDEFRKAKEAAEVNNWRFVTPQSEIDFLASKYADEFSAKYGMPVEKLNSYDAAMYGKLKEAEHIPTIETIPAAEKLSSANKQLHDSFVDTHNPVLELNPAEELVTDAYTRGYDNLINQRDPSRAGAFYENEVAPILEQTILKNKFQQETPLVRGTRDFDINNGSSVLRNNQTLDNLKFSQLQEGDLFVPNSFTSTSIGSKLDDAGNLIEIPITSFTRGHKNLDYLIKAPAGQSYLYPNASKVQNYSAEMEAILPKDLQFKVDKVVSDVDRGYLGTAADIKRGEYYGLGNNKFTKVPNKIFPSIKSFDKVKTVSRDLNTGELTYGKVSKKGIDNLIKYHNEQHQPIIPKYYFSIANPYLFGGKLNKNY